MGEKGEGQMINNVHKSTFKKHAVDASAPCPTLLQLEFDHTEPT